MATRTIVKVGDDRLKKRSREVEKINGRIQELIDDMIETLQAANGVGLAAVQVGVLRRVAIVLDEDEYLVLINPEIIEAEGEQEESEGCLSLPGKFGYVKRPEKVKVRATDRNGDELEYEAEGLMARAFCHEIDHMDGIVYVDKMSRFLTEEEIEQMRKDAEKEEEPQD